MRSTISRYLARARLQVTPHAAPIALIGAILCVLAAGVLVPHASAGAAVRAGHVLADWTGRR